MRKHEVMKSSESVGMRTCTRMYVCRVEEDFWNPCMRGQVGLCCGAWFDLISHAVWVLWWLQNDLVSCWLPDEETRSYEKLWERWNENLHQDVCVSCGGRFLKPLHERSSGSVLWRMVWFDFSCCLSAMMTAKWSGKLLITRWGNTKLWKALRALEWELAPGCMCAVWRKFFETLHERSSVAVLGRMVWFDFSCCLSAMMTAKWSGKLLITRWGNTKLWKALRALEWELAPGCMCVVWRKFFETLHERSSVAVLGRMVWFDFSCCLSAMMTAKWSGKLLITRWGNTKLWKALRALEWEVATTMDFWFAEHNARGRNISKTFTPVIKRGCADVWLAAIWLVDDFRA